MSSAGIVRSERSHRARRLPSAKVRWGRALPLYIMLLPAVAYFAVFTYFPLFHSVLISMEHFNLIGNRPFIGLANYRAVLTDPDFWDAFRNTLILGVSIFAIGFVAPIVIALSLNEVILEWMKRSIQLVIYLPYLFSWPVVGGLWLILLEPSGGLVNAILHVFGIGPIPFMSESGAARWVIILVTVWKNVGFYCVIYLAAMVSINPALYEAARVDGANRWQLMGHVTLPSLTRTMQAVGMLSLMGVLQMFDQIYVMQNSVINPQVNVLMTYVYDEALQNFNIGEATAIALLIVIFTLLMTLVLRRLIRYEL